MPLRFPDPARAGSHSRERRRWPGRSRCDRESGSARLPNHPSCVRRDRRLRGWQPDRVDDDRLLRARFDRRLVDGLKVPGPRACRPPKGNLTPCSLRTRLRRRSVRASPLGRPERCQLQVESAIRSRSPDAEFDGGRRPPARETPDLGVQAASRMSPPRASRLSETREAGFTPGPELVETARKL
jgi:hypothetical protein